jgi:ATP-dependent Lon protease
VKNDAAIAAIHEMLRRGPAYIGAFLLKDENLDTDIITDIYQIYKVGVFAQVTQCFESIHNGNRAFQLVLNPIRRIHADSLVMSTLKDASESTTPEDLGYEADNAFLRDYDISLVNNSNVETDAYQKDAPEIVALVNAITESFRDLAKQNINFRDQMSSYVFSPISGTLSTGTNDPARMADFAAAMSAGNMKALQEILETTNVEKRLRLALALLKEEILNYELQHKVRSEVEQRVNKLQKNMLLNEQLKAIRKEMGQEGDTKEKLIEMFKDRVSKLKMPESAKKVFDDVHTTTFSFCALLTLGGRSCRSSSTSNHRAQNSTSHEHTSTG